MRTRARPVPRSDDEGSRAAAMGCPLRFAANISMMFGEWEFVDRFQAARDAGFEAVEIQFPYGEPVARLARAREAAGVIVVLINAPIHPPEYPAGIAAIPAMAAEFRRDLPLVAEYAAALGVRHVNFLAGACAAPAARDAYRATLVDNLSAAAEQLKRYGVSPLLEAINPTDVPDYLVDSFEEALIILDQCGGSVGLQFDVYHAAMMGLDPVRALHAVRHVVRHVQFADAPGRHEPGTGAVAFGPVLECLAMTGYDGWIAAEYRPARTTLESLAWLGAWRSRQREEN